MHELRLRLSSCYCHWFSLQSLSLCQQLSAFYSANHRSLSSFSFVLVLMYSDSEVVVAFVLLAVEVIVIFCTLFRFDPIAVCMKSFHRFTLFPLHPANRSFCSVHQWVCPSMYGLRCAWEFTVRTLFPTESHSDFYISLLLEVRNFSINIWRWFVAVADCTSLTAAQLWMCAPYNIHSFSVSLD